jgi:hypothetical protein
MNLARWAAAFAFTQIVEVPIYRAGLGTSLGRAFAASAITHPIVWWFAVESGVPLSWAARTAIGEFFAVAVEAIWFARWFGLRRGLIWSAIANAVSFSLGLLSYRLFGG